MLIKVLRSFVYASRGIVMALYERNMRVHMLAAWFVVVAGIFFRITMNEWTILILCIGLVVALEIVNTAIEDVSNVCRDVLGAPYAVSGRARDLAAGAVLVAAIAAAIIGGIIFAPYIVLTISR